MIVTAENRQDIYLCFAYVYKFRTGLSFKWKRGEKGKVMNIFTRLCESLSMRDNGEFVDALSKFEDYLKRYSLKWLNWKESSRDNYVGFLNNRENIAIFTASSLPSSEGLNIAGVDDNSAWSF